MAYFLTPEEKEERRKLEIKSKFRIKPIHKGWNIEEYRGNGVYYNAGSMNGEMREWLIIGKTDFQWEAQKLMDYYVENKILANPPINRNSPTK